MIIVRDSVNPLLPSLAAAILIFGGCATPPTEFKEPAPLATADRAALNTQVFGAAWDLVNEKYFDAGFQGVDWLAMRTQYAPAAAAAADDEALYRVLNQMAGELRDEHVNAVSPRRVHEWRSDHKADTGLRPWKVEDRWVVMDIIPGSPAEAAGVKRGWFIVSRNELPLPGEPRLDPFLTHVGEPIRYAFIDEQDRPHELNLTPQLISSERTRFVSHDAPGGIRYLRFDSFAPAAIGWLHGEVETHREAPGMILDLRYNRGGNQIVLRRLIRAFFPGRRLLGQTVNRAGQTHDIESFALFSPLYRGKVVILTSPTTASSAEIFSHAMQFHKRAMVVGQQTAGSVVGKLSHRLPGGGDMNVPDLDFRGLDGRRLEGVGVTPDIVVPLALADLRGGRDASLDAALAWLRDNISRD